MGTNDPYVTAIYGANTIWNWLIVERRHGRQTLHVCDGKSRIYLGVINTTIASVVSRTIPQTVGTAAPNWLATAR